MSEIRNINPGMEKSTSPTNVCPTQPLNYATSKVQCLEIRPIYPNVPYVNPYCSPRSNRRRPLLRESRRVSTEQSGSFLQLNQYKLMDQIGQVSKYILFIFKKDLTKVCPTFQSDQTWNK